MTKITYTCDICGTTIGAFHSEIKFDAYNTVFQDSELELCPSCYRKLTHRIRNAVREMKRAKNNLSESDDALQASE